MEGIKRYIKDYILGLFESDLLGDMKYLENELIENNLINKNEQVSYRWSEFNDNVMILTIEGKEYKINVDIEEVK